MERALRRQRDEHKLAGFTQVIANPNPNPNPSPSPSPNPDPNPNPNQVIMTPNVGEGLTALIQTAGTNPNP